ncbi:zinc finger protein 26 [Anopheles cruzii]|uniref:zinc finger protein 26 n=1 Tax=Anopheles cruzii TaxID=68878 RepID=UPI0022EC3149|nr:zinc finger protein 26 [Anopheles cruzii]
MEVDETNEPRGSPFDPDSLVEYDPEVLPAAAATNSSVAVRSETPPAIPLEETPLVRCRACGAMFHTRNEVSRHVLDTHVSQSTAPQPVVVLLVTEKEARSMAWRTPDPRRTYVCGSCRSYVGYTLLEIQRHMRAHVCKDDKPPPYDSVVPPSVDEADTDVPSSSSAAARSYSSTSSSDDDDPDGDRQVKTIGKSFRRVLSQARHTPPDAAKPDVVRYLRATTMKSLMAKTKAEARYKCSRKGCPYRFASLVNRDQHLRCHANDVTTVSADGGSPRAGSHNGKRQRFGFKCFQCDQKYESWKKCMTHLWNDHRTDLGMSRCKLCDKRFNNVVHLYQHLQTHRPKELRYIGCRFCDLLFANRAQRSVHEALHRKPPTAAVATATATATARNRRPKQIVPSTAADAGTGQCSNGGERFAVPPAEPEKPRWYYEQQCSICHHMFSNAKILSKHIKTVHHKIKPFICNVCGYKSARKYTLNIHMRQHSGQKPLACKSCPFRAADPSVMHYHERRHREERMYQCRSCGYTTVQPSALKPHIMVHHPREYERIKCKLCAFTSVNPEKLKRHCADHEAGLIAGPEEDSREADNGASLPAESKRPPKSVLEISSDCFLPLESVDSVVHDAGGITIPAAAVISVPTTHSEDTQFPA